MGLVFLLLVCFYLSSCQGEDLPFSRVSADVVQEETESEHGGTHVDLSTWVAAHDVAHFLGISPTKRVYVPLQVNVVLIGFQGDGNHFLEVSKARLARWFEHVIHERSHVVVPLFEEQVTTRKQPPTRDTRIQYDFQLNFVMAHPLVTVALENVLLQNARTDDESSTMYVDVYRVTSLLHHLATSMRMDESSYTLFILNPKPPVEGRRYGYRAGLSRSELDALRADTQWLQKLQVLVAGRKASAEGASGQNIAVPPMEGAETGNGKVWAEWYLRYATAAADDCRSNNDDDGTEASPSCLAHWSVAGLSIHALTRHMARSGTKYHLRYLQSVLRDQIPNDCLVDSWVSHDRFAFLDVSAGPFEWSPMGSAAPGVRTRHTVPRPPSGRAVHATQDSVASALDTLKTIYKQKCLTDDVIPTQDCERILAQVKSTAKSVVDEVETISDVNVQTDYWLADMSALTSRALQHLFTPGIPLFETPYARHINVVVHIVKTHETYKPRDPSYFAAEDYVAELKRLAAPGQKFTITIREVSVASEKALALAFHESMKSTVIPSVDPETGTFKPERVVYVDSMTLRSKLIPIAPSPRTMIMTERSISVFLFSTNYPYPVLVDKYYQAKALSDMVIVTQSNFEWYTSRIQCNGKPVIWDLRDPTREALSASALLIGGLIPSHLSYSTATSCTTQEWLWSVGDSPFSHTSHGMHFSVLHKDMAARNYILAGLEQSINSTNHMIARLSHVQTSPSNFLAISKLDVATIEQALADLRMIWQEVLNDVGRLHWELCLERLPEIVKATYRFEGAVQSALELLEQHRCSSVGVASSSSSWIPILVGVGILDTVSVLAYVFLRKGRAKVKIN